MSILQTLRDIWTGINTPVLIFEDETIYFDDIEKQDTNWLNSVKPGDVVAIIGDFNVQSISTLIKVMDLGAIVVPLTNLNSNDHEYFFEVAGVNKIIRENSIEFREQIDVNPLIVNLLKSKLAGIIFFSSGSTGRPKAVLHRLDFFMKRFEQKRKSFRTISFLLFDHIGGINTLLHTLFNKGTIIVPKDRNVGHILDISSRHLVELLPTTPTFLRMLLMSGLIPDYIPKSIKLITYGTERMDQGTLDVLCDLLPNVDFRQTYGLSEVGILRVKSKDRNNLFMRIGGEGIETKIVDDILHIRSQYAMVGYLNSENPFDEDGWYNTNDIVIKDGQYIKIIGRANDVINVGGVKFLPLEVERAALSFKGILFAKAYPRNNPITGQHVELKIQFENPDVNSPHEIKEFLEQILPKHMMPRRIIVEKSLISHRMKRN
jgi:acyl-coenzyme A synthetase/AMP-(fatty) acid ligase